MQLTCMLSHLPFPSASPAGTPSCLSAPGAYADTSALEIQIVRHGLTPHSTKSRYPYTSCNISSKSSPRRFRTSSRTSWTNSHSIQTCSPKLPSQPLSWKRSGSNRGSRNRSFGTLAWRSSLIRASSEEGGLPRDAAALLPLSSRMPYHQVQQHLVRAFEVHVTAGCRPYKMS